MVIEITPSTQYHQRLWLNTTAPDPMVMTVPQDRTKHPVRLLPGGSTPTTTSWWPAGFICVCCGGYCLSLGNVHYIVQVKHWCFDSGDHWLLLHFKCDEWNLLLEILSGEYVESKLSLQLLRYRIPSHCSAWSRCDDSAQGADNHPVTVLHTSRSNNDLLKIYTVMTLLLLCGRTPLVGVTIRLFNATNKMVSKDALRSRLHNHRWWWYTLQLLAWLICSIETQPLYFAVSWLYTHGAPDTDGETCSGPILSPCQITLETDADNNLSMEVRVDCVVFIW